MCLILLFETECICAPDTCCASLKCIINFFLQESTKVSELNPNAKVWGNHMLHLEASGATDGSVSKTWEEIPDQPPDSCKEGMNKSFWLLLKQKLKFDAGLSQF